MGTIASGSGAGTAAEGERPPKDDSQPLGLHWGPAQSRYSILPPGLQGAGSLRERGTTPGSQEAEVRCKLSSVLFCDVDEVI